MNKSVAKIVDKMIDSQIIEAADRELYEFGIQQGATLLLNVLTTIGIGFVIGMFWESLLFLILYTPLRVYAGGFHARTQMRCYLFSVFIVLGSLTLIRIMQNASLPSIIIMAVAGGVIWNMAPVENQAKPLTETEIMVYGERTRRMLIFEILIYLCAVVLRWYFLQPVICTAISAAAIMVIGGSKNNITVNGR